MAPPMAAVGGASAGAPSRPAEAVAGGAQASAASAAALSSRDDEARAQLMRRMKADWCGFGSAEHDRQTDAIMERAQAKHGMVGVEAFEEMKLAPGAQVLEEAVAQVRQRWVKALVQRGDPRAIAVAEFLGGADGDAPQARARLQALARTSSDPMVTALALQRPCEAGACNNIEASQWSRLEPANLQAWLKLLRDLKGSARQTQIGYALERMASEARYSRTYEREYKALLLSLPQTEAPGLANQAEMQLLIGTASAWAIAGFRPLTEVCRTGLADAATAHRCEAVADRLWEQDNLLDRAIALDLARRMIAARPEQKARWEPRAREYEAASSWQVAEVERAGQSVAQEEAPCAGQVEMRKIVQEMTARGEWDHLRAEMSTAGADDAVLSARWRQQKGRSALDPEKWPIAASAPTR